MQLLGYVCFHQFSQIPDTFSSPQDDDDEVEMDGDMVEQGERGPTPETDSDRANLFLQKLQDLTEIFESKNEDYQAMEKKSEQLRKVSELHSSPPPPLLFRVLTNTVWAWRLELVDLDPLIAARTL